MKSDFLKCKKFNYVVDFARCKKLRTETDFNLVIVEGSKLGMKSDYNCRTNSKAGTYFDFESDFDTQTKVKNKNRFQWLNIINISSENGLWSMGTYCPAENEEVLL